MTGRPINQGDKVLNLDPNGNMFAGVVVAVQSSSVIVQPLRPSDQWSFASGSCVHVDEVAQKLAPPPPIDNAYVAAGHEKFVTADQVEKASR